MSDQFITREEHANAVDDVKNKVGELQLTVAQMVVTQKDMTQQMKKTNELFSEVIKINADQTHIKETLDRHEKEIDVVNKRIDKTNERLETEKIDRLAADNHLSERITENRTNAGWFDRIGGKLAASALGVICIAIGAYVKSLIDKG